MQQLQREIQTSAEVITQIKYIKQSTEKSRGITQIMKKDDVEINKEIIQTKAQQQKIQIENA